MKVRLAADEDQEKRERKKKLTLDRFSRQDLHIDRDVFRHDRDRAARVSDLDRFEDDGRDLVERVFEKARQVDRRLRDHVLARLLLGRVELERDLRKVQLADHNLANLVPRRVVRPRRLGRVRRPVPVVEQDFEPCSLLGNVSRNDLPMTDDDDDDGSTRSARAKLSKR